MSWGVAKKAKKAYNPQKTGYLKAVWPDLFGYVFEVWPAPGAREDLKKRGGLRPPPPKQKQKQINEIKVEHKQKGAL